MRMANKTNVNVNKEAETVEEVKAVDDAPVTEGTDVQVNEEETVPADNKEEAEAAKPKPKHIPRRWEYNIWRIW